MLFLVEYEKGMFVDANEINWLAVVAKKVIFTQRGDIESVFAVHQDMQANFFNHLGAINDNPCCVGIEERFMELAESQ